MDNADEPLFTDAEIERRVRRYLNADRAIDAGFNEDVLSGLTRGVDRAKIHVMRIMFFRGAQYLFDLLKAMGESSNPKKVEYTATFFKDLDREFKAFHKAKGSPPEPELEPRKGVRKSAQKCAKVRKPAQ